VLDTLQDEGIREMDVMCSAQSAKTETMLVALLWIIVNDPGPILWLTKNKEEAKKLVKMRLGYMMEACTPVRERMPRERGQKMTLEIYFPGAPLVIAGADSLAALQSTPYRYIFCDENRSYKPGAAQMVAKRVRSFTHNYKFLKFSTPGDKKAPTHAGYEEGDRRRRLVPCPACGLENNVCDWGDKNTPGGLKWDTNETTKPDGQWNWDEMAKTIRYKCWNPECDHAWTDKLSDRKYLSRVGRWERQNPNAASDHATFWWSGILPWWVAFREQVEEYLKARESLKYGDPAPMKVHVCETRGLPWSDDWIYEDEQDWVEGRELDYNPNEKWDKEIDRIATMDVQGKGGRHYWYVIRALSAAGGSRLLAYGKADSKTEMDQILDYWEVKQSNRCWDAAHFSTEVYNYVVASGYKQKALRGDYRDEFVVAGKRTIWQTVQADPAMGTSQQGRVRPIELWQWSKYGALDRLDLLKRGAIGDWRIFKGTDERYRTQMTAWERRDKELGRGQTVKQWYCRKKGNEHLHACEEMQVVAAVIKGLLRKQDEGELEL
jgi:hypothetical protein